MFEDAKVPQQKNEDVIQQKNNVNVSIYNTEYKDCNIFLEKYMWCVNESWGQYSKERGDIIERLKVMWSKFNITKRKAVTKWLNENDFFNDQISMMIELFDCAIVDLI